MEAPMQEEMALSLLRLEKEKARAKAILGRPPSTLPTSLVTLFLVGLGVFLEDAARFEAPLWVRVLLVVVVSATVTNAIELWMTRRRLEAAITLLKIQQESDK